MSKYMTVSISP